MDTLELAGQRVAQLWLGGAASGPVVLFFHGCPDTRWAARSGEDAAREAGLRLLCVNRPGYGASSPAPSSHASVADDAAEVLDRLGITEVAALGMSVGGAYAAGFAARHAHRTRALGVVNTLPMSAGPPQPSVEEAMEAARPEFEVWAASMDVGDPDDAAVAARWTGALAPPDAALVCSRSSPAEIAAAAREALADHHGYLRDAALAFRPWDVDVSDVRCPTTLWYGGADDRALPGADWFATRIPHADVVVRPDRTHWATLAAYWPEVLATLAHHH